MSFMMSAKEVLASTAGQTGFAIDFDAMLVF
jgi:hypothetical protein